MAIAPYKKLGGDAFGDALKIQLAALQPEETGNWHRIFNHAASANGARPGKAFLSTAKELRETLGKEWVRRHMQHWFQHAVSAKIIERNRSETYGGQTSNWIEQTAFTQSNGVLLKGLVWMCEGFRNSKTVNLIADLCEKSMKKLPGVGPAAQATANACLLYLENTPGTEATARLSRLSTAIKQKNVQKRVHEIVAKKAEQAGITTIQLEERIVPTYGLENGTKTVAFDDYSLRIEVEGPGKVSQTWLKPDGSPQKSKPKAVAEKAALKTLHGKITTEVATLKKILSAQRDRIDRMLAEDIEWPLEEVMRYYVGHDLVGTIARRLIWSLSTGDIVTSAIFHDEGWQDVTGTPVPVDEATNARLWHPVDCPVDEVIAWRARLGALGIVQPCKQAYREVYLLTNAERTTEVYSNRMAAHMLEQHRNGDADGCPRLALPTDGLVRRWPGRSIRLKDVRYLVPPRRIPDPHQLGQ